MATYNRPGVYIEEVATNNPIAVSPTATIATFIGALAKGPLVPTLVTSWSQFTSTYGNFTDNAADIDVVNAVNLFFSNGGSQCYIQRAVVTVAATSGSLTTDNVTLTITSASSLSTSDGGSSGTITSANAVGAVITGIGIPSGTIISAVSGTTLTLSQKATVPAGTALTVTTVVSSSVAVKGNSTVATTTTTTTASGTTVTVTTASAHNLKVGQTVVIAGTVSSGSTPTSAYNGTFVITSVPTTTTFTVTNALSPAAAVSTAGTVTSQSATTELTLVAKTPGAWSNGLYYEISSSTNNTSYPGKYFNLAIYSGGTTSGYIVERFNDITLLSSDSSYAPTIINASSNYVIATDSNATNHTAALFSTTNTPLSTALTSVTATSGVATSSSTTLTITATAAISVGMFVYGNGITSGTTVATFNGTTSLTLSAAMSVPASTALTFVNAGLTGGSDGLTVINAAISATSSTAKLDTVSQPILLNAPGVTAASDVNLLLTYAYNRGDVFVIIDPTQATLDVTSQLALANSYTGGTAGFNALGFGAVYYPNLTIPSPTVSTPGATITAYPGGAVAAKYAATDAARGVFKSPAGLEARLSGVIAVASLTNSELDYLNNGTSNPNTFATATPVNTIRYVPGAGIVVMGARTLNTGYQYKYVSVRRSLIYLRKLLTDITSFAMFESNDDRLWSRLQNTCESALIDFWNSGGLKGTSAQDAFYVKSDSTINTTSSIAAGEVHLEIGVALQRPAEFVVIRISQYDSGSVVTVL